MIDEMLLNASKPQLNEKGNMMLEHMNSRHNDMALWALSHIELATAKNILDIGCGGGMNINNLVNMSNAYVRGIDYSQASVNKSREVNKGHIANNRAEVLLGDASNLPFASNSMDIVTAFETIYYWKNAGKIFDDIHQLLTDNGVFMIFNEDSTDIDNQLMKQLDGTIYTPQQIKQLLINANFSHVDIFIHDNGTWVTAAAKK